MQRSTFCPNGNRLIEPTVFQTQIVEHPQRLAGEPAELVVMAFRLEFADHHQRNHDLVLGEPRDGPGI